MNINNNNNKNYTIDLGSAVFIVFLVLKLCKVIDWSWWWVTCPLWAPVALVLVLGIIYAIFSD